MYRVGILELFHRPDVVSGGNSTPEAARSWAMPCDDSFRSTRFSTMGWLENPVYFSLAGRYTFAHSSQGCSRMTLYGYARVSVREPEDKNLDLQVERLVRAGCSLGNIRAEEASGARNDRGGLLELLDLVVEGDTLVVTRIDRLSRGLTHGLQVIEDLHLRGVEFRSLAEAFDTATASGKIAIDDGPGFFGMVAELHQGAVHRWSAQGTGRRTVPWAAHRPDRPAEGVHPGGVG